MPIQYYFGIGGLIAGGLISFVIASVVFGLNKKKAEAIIKEAEAKSVKITEEAEVAAKQSDYKRREAFARETQEVKEDLKQFERRLIKREDAIDKKAEMMQKREKTLEIQEKNVQDKDIDLKTRIDEVTKTIEKEKEALHSISGLTKEDATKILLEKLEKELQSESAALIQKYQNISLENADMEAKKVITMAIQRCAVEYTAENVVSTVDLPSEDMKGRIIGREGRNIRAFEKATGVDVIVDDTPGVIVISGFDSVRREMAKRSMEKLILDGRIHPARIEELVEQTKKEIEDSIQQVGKQICYEMDIHNLHPKLVTLLGRLQYRTSYGQNALQHSIEVAQLCAMIASEMRYNVSIARRAGLLHDIGKAVDQEMEGPHPDISAELLKRFGESAEVVDAGKNHHGDANPQFAYTVITMAADAISASRPGARRETLEKYIKRLERLESIATSFPAVESAFAIQAGREIRVIVNASKVDDKGSTVLARDIANEIEKELNYPGEIKVTLIRETRIVEYAR